jgi:class 3 adenylate cyclase
MVTDLVGSTALRSRLGEEAADRLHHLHERLLRDIVERHGGVVVKGLGDGVLASFGGAAEAVASAVAIQQATDFHSRRHPDETLVVRIGLSAGDVTVEEDGDRVGTAVIEAARLCAAARGGQILAADLVAALTRGRGGHRFNAVGDFELKGIAEAVPTLEVTWEADRPVGAEMQFPPLLLGSGAFAGRAAQLELLERTWKEAAAGIRRAALVAGEAGVGKTRLAAELARRVHDGGGMVLYGRCEEDLGVPYEPFVEALRWFCEHVPAAELESRLGRYPPELARLVPELRRLLPDLEPALQSDSETEQYRFFEAVTSWLATGGDPGGLLFVIDDLHWAPAPTIALLAHVLRSGGPAPLLVLATFRATDLGSDHPLSPVLAGLRRTEGIERLALGGLTVDELAQLLDTLPKAQTARALAISLHEATEGNPFFVGELLRDAAESGFDAGTLSVPEGVREVIVSRVARLSSSCQDVLGVAAVLGRAVELGPVARVAEIAEDAAVAVLDEALAAGLVEETGVGAYRFVHALVRSALYESVSATRRARLHLRAADAFEDDAARLAHHLLACGPLADVTRTARACLAAGDYALRLLADTEAAEWYAHGLTAAGDEDPALRIDLLTGLGEAQRLHGDTAFRQTLLDASRLAIAHSEIARLVRAVLANSRGTTSVIGQVDEERLELIDRALDLTGSAFTAGRADLLALQAMELVFAGEHDRLLRAADEAAAIAVRLSDPTLQARVGTRRLWACLVPDRILEMAQEGADVVRLTDATADPQLRTWSRALWIHSLLQAGALDEARRRADEGLAIADETGLPGLRFLAQMFYASVLDALGEHDDAERLTDAAINEESGFPDAVMWYGAGMWLHWTFGGQVETAAAVAAQGFAGYPVLWAWQGAWALDLALAGQKEELAEFLTGLPPRLPFVPRDMFWVVTHFYYAVAQGFGVEDQRVATTVYEALLPHRDRHAAYGLGYWGPVEIALAIAARVIGNSEAALAHHEAAAAIIDRCGAARARALNGYQWARTLLTRDAIHDRRHAAEIARVTLVYCETKAYATFVTKTKDLLADIN